MQVYDQGTYRVIKVGPLGQFANNAYIIIDPATSEAAIVDMPAEGEKILAAAQGLKVTKLLLTHAHPDHTPSYDLLKQATGAPVYCHPAETRLPAERIDVPLADGDQIMVGSVPLRVIHTPGHTPGSVCFLVGLPSGQPGKHLIAGDTLFPGGPGHSDKPEDLQEEIRSIVARLYVLPEDTIVLTGHGDNTTIGASRREYEAFASRPHPPDLCGDVLWESS